MYIYYGLSATQIVETIYGEDEYDEDEMFDDEEDLCRVEELDDAEDIDELPDVKEAKIEPVQALMPITVAAIASNVCSICYDEFDEDDVQGDMLLGTANPTKISMRGCKHPFCRECLHHYIKVKLGNAYCLYHSVRCSPLHSSMFLLFSLLSPLLRVLMFCLFCSLCRLSL